MKIKKNHKNESHLILNQTAHNRIAHLSWKELEEQIYVQKQFIDL